MLWQGLRGRNVSVGDQNMYFLHMYEYFKINKLKLNLKGRKLKL